MGQSEQEHFAGYPAHTQIKHTILKKYLRAYFDILKTHHRVMVYLDGFAGRGTYTDKDGTEFPGSPLTALEVIGRCKGTTSLRGVFVEHNESNFSSLCEAVETYLQEHDLAARPTLRCGAFSSVVPQVLDEIIDEIGYAPPTFAFVDPCGITDVSFDTVKRVLLPPGSEALLFFNLDAVRRVFGLSELSRTVIDLYGSQSVAESLQSELHAEPDATKREQRIVTTYRDRITSEIGARYVTLFRIESKQRNATSHYLIHITRHHRGFSIMKDVMWPLGRTSSGTGGLALCQHSIRYGTDMFRLDWEEFKSATLLRLSDNEVSVAAIYEDWVAQPEDEYCETAYRRALLELEDEGRIVVVGSAGEIVNACSRRRKSGCATLSKRYSVRAL